MTAPTTPDTSLLMPHLPEPDRLAALGEVSIRHGFLDLVLRRTIKTLAGVTIAEADKALARAGARELRDLVERHAKRRLGKGHPDVLRVKALLRDCEDVTEQRNGLTHDLWAKYLDGDAVLYRHDGATVQMPPAAEMRALANRILSLALALNEARLGGFLYEALGAADQIRDPGN
jgi:hypothetical protein